MKKFIDIPLIFRIFFLIFLPLNLSGIKKIKPVFPFESLLNREIYLDKLFRNREEKQKIAETEFGYNDSKIFSIKIYNKDDFVEFNSRFKPNFSINKFQLKIDSLHFCLNNYNWENKDDLEILNPGLSYSQKNIFGNLKVKYRYFSKFDLHNFDFLFGRNWFELPFSLSASQENSYDVGVRFIKKNTSEIYAGGLNYSNDGKEIFPYLLISFEKNSCYFFTSELSLEEDSYPIKSYFSGNSLFWKSFKPENFSNAILKKKLSLNFEWQNQKTENRLNGNIYFFEKYWRYFWTENSFNIGTEDKKIYTADFSYSLRMNSSLFSVKLNFGELEDFNNEAEISFVKKIFINDIETQTEILWIRNLKINNNKFSYPELEFRLIFTKINTFFELNYSYLNDEKYPTKSNLAISIGVNLWKQK